MQTPNSPEHAGPGAGPQHEREALKAEIRRLAKEKNAVILAHYYTEAEVQDVADFVGDSLALAQAAAKTDAGTILMCGVHFMGETCKLLCPGKRVLVPDAQASCSLAESCPADAFRAFVEAHPGRTVVSYVNTSAAVKALTDVVVTSSNAEAVVGSLPEDEKIIFGPDRNLGAYIRRRTGRDMLLWDGACHVHESFSAEGIARLRRQHPGAPVLAHPECPARVVEQADVVGSTAALLAYARKSGAEAFIVATECGILHEMRKACPGKLFLPAPTAGADCGVCPYMRLATLEKMRRALSLGEPEIHVDPATAERALQPILRMLGR